MVKIYVCTEDHLPDGLIEKPIPEYILTKAFSNADDANEYCENMEKKTGFTYSFTEIEMEED